MRFEISRTIAESHPMIKTDLREIASVSRTLDRDIKLKGVFVSVRSHPSPADWCGVALNEHRSMSRLWRRLIDHPCGRINLSIGRKTGWEDLVRLFAHELRHIGQYAREAQFEAFCTTTTESELDAEIFELRVLKRMRSK